MKSEILSHSCSPTGLHDLTCNLGTAHNSQHFDKCTKYAFSALLEVHTTLAGPKMPPNTMMFTYILCSMIKLKCNSTGDDKTSFHLSISVATGKFSSIWFFTGKIMVPSLNFRQLLKETPHCHTYKSLTPIHAPCTLSQ